MHKVRLDRLKRLRSDHELSQREMAEILGFNNVFPYHRKESGVQSFTAEEIHQISSYFDVDVEYFFENKIAENANC